MKTRKKSSVKVFNYIPTPRSLDKSSTLHDPDKFYGRVKLPAFFNDPNKGFIDVSEEDEYNKYRKTNSKWIPPTTVQGIDNFISRCKEEISAIDFQNRTVKKKLKKLPSRI